MAEKDPGRRPVRGRRRGWTLLCLLLVLAATGPLPWVAQAARAETLPGGWSEDGNSAWESIPGKSVRAGEAALSVRADLPPGARATFGKEVAWRPAPGEPFFVEMQCGGPNRTSRDYREGDARFLFRATLVFGQDRRIRGFSARVGRFFRRMVRGFPPAGARLTYACGNGPPVGSMYRPSKEEAVFLLAAAEEGGGKVSTKRDLLADFRAAYASDPVGPVTRVLVALDRPGKEKGTVPVEGAIGMPGAAPPAAGNGPR